VEKSWVVAHRTNRPTKRTGNERARTHNFGGAETGERSGERVAGELCGWVGAKLGAWQGLAGVKWQ